MNETINNNAKLITVLRCAADFLESEPAMPAMGFACASAHDDSCISFRLWTRKEAEEISAIYEGIDWVKHPYDDKEIEAIVSLNNGAIKVKFYGNIKDLCIPESEPKFLLPGGGLFPKTEPELVGVA